MTARKIVRREFLKTGSVGIIGLTAATLYPQNLFAAQNRGNATLLGLGYAATVPAAGESVRLTAAEKSLVGDPAFISRGARVTIHSFARAARYQGTRGGAAIDVFHPALGYSPEKYPRFRAWSHSTDKDVENVGGAIGFTVPVTATRGLQLLVRPVTPDTDDPATERLTLTLGSEFGALKLQRGVYVIAFRESAADSVPAWSTHSVSSKGGQLAVDTSAFSYAVATIDYAG